MRYYVASYNGVLDELQKKLAGKLASPRDADVWITWQDAQGSFKDLISTQKKLGLGKTVFTVQHGCGSTRDYDAPNSFPLLADRYLCWGKSDYERMVKLGYSDRSYVVGCPLNKQIQPKVPHKEKVVLFVPVNTGKEEPENIAVYYELLKHKYSKAQTLVLEQRKALKDKWGLNGKRNVSFNELAVNFDVVSKLLPWHDRNLYHGNSIVGYQDVSKNNDLVFNLLRNVDLVVGIDEGTTEMFAYGHDVPVLIVDGFKFRQHKDDGKSFSSHDIYRTPAAQHCELQDLSHWIDYMLAHPEHLKKERAEIAERELGISYGDATSNILTYVRSYMKNHEPIKA